MALGLAAHAARSPPSSCVRYTWVVGKGSGFHITIQPGQALLMTYTRKYRQIASCMVAEGETDPSTFCTIDHRSTGLARNVPTRPRTASSRITQGSNISPMALMHATSTAHTTPNLTNADCSGEQTSRSSATPTRETTSESVDGGVSESEWRVPS